MTETMSTIQTDFDRIALLSSDGCDHNNHYHQFLLCHMPSPCREALEIGCGTGALTRQLAKRSNRVLALDLSPNMIRAARERSQEFSNIDFQEADVTAWDFPLERFDCIATVATLHHLPTREMFAKMKGALKVGGCLLVLDLFQAEGLIDLMTNALAIPFNVALRLAREGRLRAPREVRDAWSEHGKHDVYLTMEEVREVCREILPGAEVRKHLLWRYSIVWKKIA
jgi:ubiquinone/menaquinone biosynthesis C-methylase UbiE